MRLKKEDCCAVVIDIQYRLFPHIYDFEQLELNCARLIEGLNILEIPMIMTEQYPKGLGPTISTLRELVRKEVRPIEKRAFSCCGEPDFIKAIEETGRKNIIIMGIETHVCVLQTVLDLVERGYHPVLVGNCVSSRKKTDRDFAIERIRSEGAIVTTYESLLFELLESSEAAEFKAISNLVK
jgi:nicotinamidase-related amidase